MLFPEGEARSHLLSHNGRQRTERPVGPVYVACLLASLNVRESLRVVLRGPGGHISIPLSEFHAVPTPVTFPVSESSEQQVWRYFDRYPDTSFSL